MKTITMTVLISFLWSTAVSAQPGLFLNQSTASIWVGNEKYQRALQEQQAVREGLKDALITEQGQQIDQQAQELEGRRTDMLSLTSTLGVCKTDLTTTSTALQREQQSRPNKWAWAGWGVFIGMLVSAAVAIAVGTGR
jgi:hypothetical protein